MRDGSKYDLIIAGISAASLILIITRSLVAVLPREPEVNTDRFAAASPQLTEAGHAQGATRFIGMSPIGERMALKPRAYDQFHTDMSPGGYWLQMSVALATTPLLFQKIFMWLGQASHSGSPWGA